MKSNADKCLHMVSSNEKVTVKISSQKIVNTKHEKLIGINLESRLVTVKISSHKIVNTKHEKLIGINLESRLSFHYCISEICKKASHKVYVLARVRSGMSF